MMTHVFFIYRPYTSCVIVIKALNESKENKVTNEPKVKNGMQV